MISSSTIAADRERRRSSGTKIVPFRRESHSRQVEAIDKEKDDGSDVEAPSNKGVMKPLRRRMSSKFRTRETIVRLLHENNDRRSSMTSKTTSHHRESFFSPFDWLVAPPADSQISEANIHEEFEEKRKLMERPPPKYIMLPQNHFRLAWDFFMAILLCIMAFYIPYRVCFYWNDEEEEDETSPVFLFEMMVDAMFALDIILNFFTAYTDHSTSLVITSHKLIAKKYLKSYFLVDLIATLPLGYILTHSSSTAIKIGKLGRLPKLVKFVRGLRLLKLLRVYKLQKFIMRLEGEYNVHHGVSRLIKIVMTIMMVTHMVGCFWYLIGLSAEDGWVLRYGLVLSPKNVQYVAAMYWAFSTLTTVGYGDISARAPQEQIYAMVMMLVGVSWYAYIVSSMSSIMSTFDAQNKAVRDKMLCVNEFVRAAKLPKDLSKQVREFFDFKLAKSRHAFLMSTNYDVDELLDELGSGLRSEVLMYMDRHLISKIPFFEGKVPQFVADTISMFQPMVFQEGDYICKEGTQADEMFFMVKGSAGIYYGDKLVVVIEEGSYFGEIGCILGGIRRAGVKALTTVELQALSRRNLNILLAEYPEVGEELKSVARNRASIAKKGQQEEADSQNSIPLTIEPTAVAPSLIATPPPASTDARYLALVEKEVERIVTSISIKIRNDMGLITHQEQQQRQ